MVRAIADQSDVPRFYPHRDRVVLSRTSSLVSFSSPPHPTPPAQNTAFLLTRNRSISARGYHCLYLQNVFMLIFCHPPCRLRLNSAHYNKMRELFGRSRGSRSGLGTGSSAASRSGSFANSGDAAWVKEFHDCLFACLMRYEALQVCVLL